MDIKAYELLLSTEQTEEAIESLIKDKEFFRLGSEDPAKKKEHSRLIDKILDFDVDKIENQILKDAMHMHPQGNMGSWGPDIHDGSQTWIGIDPQTLQTPYSELYEMLSLICETPLERVVDLGAGYGRMGIALNAFYPHEEVQFIGHEIVPERVIEGNRVYNKLGIHNCELCQTDINKANFQLPVADLYFVYDFSNPKDIKVLLDKFAEIFFHKEVLIIARGDGIRSLIHNQYPLFYSNFQPIHKENWSLYSSYKEMN